MVLPKCNRPYTYQEYRTWTDEKRWEIIDGILYAMSPAPDTEHQIIAGNCYGILRNALKGKSCIPFIAPTDVVLSEVDVVQPDVLVVCDKQKITKQNIQGAPDLVIEILSPSTSLKDRREKKRLYEKYGVREYLLIDPIGRYVQRCCLGDNGFYGKEDIFAPPEVLTLKSLPGIEVPMEEVFRLA